MISLLFSLLWLTAVAYWADVAIGFMIGVAVGVAVASLVAHRVIKNIKRETWG